MTDLKERLEGDAKYIREIVKAAPTPIPGGGQRIYVDPKRVEEIAENIEEKLRERPATAFEAAHPGYCWALGVADGGGQHG